MTAEATARQQFPGRPGTTEWADTSLAETFARYAAPVPPREVMRGPVTTEPQRSELVRAMHEVACHLNLAVHTGDEATIAAALLALSPQENLALHVVQAAMTRPGPPCDDCSLPRMPRPGGGWEGALDLCQPCYDRARGTAKRSTPRRRRAEHLARERHAEYAWLRDAGEIPENAARRVGLRTSANTAERYESVYRAAKRAGQQQAPESGGIAA